MNSAKPLWKTYLMFLAPMMLANILQALSGTINNIYLGQMIGVRALAAASVSFPLVFFFIAFIIGLGAGASVLIGQAYGAKQHEKVKAIAGTALTVALMGGLIIALFGGGFAHALLVLLGTPPDILADAVSYARIMLIAMPGLFVFLLMTSMMRGVGDTVTPLYALCLSTAIGLIVTPALIRGWFGLPQMGVASAACAAVLSFAVALVWLAVYMRRRGHALAPDAVLIRHLWIDWEILKKVLRIGVPTGIQMVIISLSEVAVLSFVNHYGSNATAAYGAVNQILSYVQFPVMSIAISASILGAQAIGAGHADRLGAIARTGLQMNLVLTGGLIVLAYIFSRPIIGFFITSAPVIELAQTLLHITLWSSIVMGFSSVLSGVMRASGTVLMPTAISIFAIACVEVPVAYLLSQRIGINGIWSAYPVAFLTMLALQSAYYLLVWRRKPVHRLL